MVLEYSSYLLHKLKLENFYNAILFTNSSYDFFLNCVCYLKKKHSQITNTISLSFLFITQIDDELYLHKIMNR